MVLGFMISGFGLRTQELSAGSFMGTVIGHGGGYYVDYWLHIMLSPTPFFRLEKLHFK